MSKTCKCKEKHTPPVNGSPESHTKQAWHRFARFLRKCFLFRFIGRATPLFVLMLVPFAMVLGLGEAFGLPGLFASFRVGGVSILGTYAVIGVCAFLIDVSHDRSFAREVLDPSGALDPESSRDFARLLGRYLLCFTGCWVLLFMVVACVSRAGMFFREQGAGAVVLSLVLLAIVAIGLAMDGRGSAASGACSCTSGRRVAALADGRTATIPESGRSPRPGRTPSSSTPICFVEA